MVAGVAMLVLAACTSDASSTTTGISSTSSVTANTTPDSTVPTPVESVLSVPCNTSLATYVPSADGMLSSAKIKINTIDDGDGATGYTVSVHDDDGWSPLATVEPLARLAYMSPAGDRLTVPIEPAQVGTTEDSMTLTSTSTDDDGATWTVRIEITLDTSDCVVDVTSGVVVDRDRELLLFASPVLDVGRDSFGTEKDTAVLGGLDWTVAGEESQAMAVVPDPLDVAWPMMALAHEDHLVGLMWDPLQKWDGENIMPQPLFASPNWVEGKDSHLLGLGIPNAPDWMGESPLVDERDAAEKTAAEVPLIDRVTRPYQLTAGSTMTVDSSIVADYPAEIPQAVQLYTDRFGLPPAPDFSMEAGLESVIDAYLDTAWDSETAGWYQGTFGAVAPYITVVTQLAAYADVAEPNRASAALDRIGEAMGAQWQSRHDPGPSSAHMDYIDYGFRTGDVEEVLSWSASSDRFARSTQRADGSWGYSEADNICSGSLGGQGDSLLGTNVINASIILENARITRNHEDIDAGMRALDYMDRFVKPAGAQVGEVPLVHGDPWAVAWAVRTYVEGYRISGDPHHLEKAREWALKGIPFMYTWSHPDRPVMAYSVIGVMGTSCWTLPWSGIAVQWVGLDYAASLLELASVDETYPWSDIAEGIGRAAVGMLDDRPPNQPGEWTELTLTTTAPVDARGLGFSVRVNHELTLPGPTEFFVDDVELVDLATGENLIKNGDFDSAGLDEFPWSWDAETVERVSGGDCRSGSCVHATVAGDQILGASADIVTPAVPHHRYRLNLWVKLADDPPPSSGPLFRVEYFLDHNEAKWVSAFARPLRGLLPDVYDIADQQGYAPILPERLGDVLLGLLPTGLHVKSVSIADEVAVSGLVEIGEGAIGDDGALSFSVTPLTDGPTHLVVATNESPSTVQVDGETINGWRWNPDTGRLVVTISHRGKETLALTIR